MKNIHVVCDQIEYKYFSDYCESISKYISVSFLIVDDVKNIIINPDDIYLFCHQIPIAQYAEFKNIYLINTEQLTKEVNSQYIKMIQEKEIKIIDYDLYQSKLFNNFYLPYQLNPEENQRLSLLVQKTPKIYDIAICTNTDNSIKRTSIVNELIKNNLTVIDAVGFTHERDVKISQAKVLINIHWREDYQIYEHFRCDRWIFAGMMVITENSLSDALLDINDLLIIEKYDNFVNKTLDVIANYETYRSQFLSKFKDNKKKLADQRSQYCQNFLEFIR